MSQKNVAKQTVMSIMPLSSEINAYYWGFKYLEEAAKDEDLSDEGKEVIVLRQKYLRYMMKRLPLAVTKEPALALALTRAALDVNSRNFLLKALNELANLIDKEFASKKPIDVKTDEPAAQIATPSVSDVTLPTAAPKDVKKKPAAKRS